VNGIGGLISQAHSLGLFIANLLTNRNRIAKAKKPKNYEQLDQFSSVRSRFARLGSGLDPHMIRPVHSPRFPPLSVFGVG